MATTRINPYLTFDGNCEEAFLFYHSVFGGEFLHFSRFKDVPGDYPFLEKEKDHIMHVALPIGEHTFLMGSDRPASTEKGIAGNQIAISINALTESEAKKFFDGLSQGGTITMPLEKTFWNALFGMLTDKFGIHWMVNYDYPQ